MSDIIQDRFCQCKNSDNPSDRFMISGYIIESYQYQEMTKFVWRRVSLS